MDRESQEHLEASIRRVQEAVARGHANHAQILQTVLAAAGVQALEHINYKMQRKAQRRLERARRREERHAWGCHSCGPADHEASKPVGYLFAAGAVAALALAATHPHLWWMYCVAFGMGVRAASTLGKAYSRDRHLPAAPSSSKTPALTETDSNEVALEESEPKTNSVIDQRLARVDAICQKTLAELKAGAASVRDFVHRPEETLQALSTACRELARRESDLRSALTEEDDQRLRRERTELEARVTAEKDTVVHQRLHSALQALDAQLAQRAALATSASRLEAEQTRILYTLESLHTQVLRARAADSASADVAGVGLRQSLAQIAQEIEAVAAALEDVNREDASASARSSLSGPAPSEREMPAQRSRERS